MMKNPPSLQVNLDYLAEPPEQVFVAVDEGTPDPSWVYGIDLSKIEPRRRALGHQGWQFATRFGYDDIPVRRGRARARARRSNAFLALPKPARGTQDA